MPALGTVLEPLSPLMRRCCVERPSTCVDHKPNLSRAGQRMCGPQEGPPKEHRTSIPAPEIIWVKRNSCLST
eukprot:4438038-Pyramimonas_sp.AAC.1